MLPTLGRYELDGEKFNSDKYERSSPLEMITFSGMEGATPRLLGTNAEGGPVGVSGPLPVLKEPEPLIERGGVMDEDRYVIPDEIPLGAVETSDAGECMTAWCTDETLTAEGVLGIPAFGDAIAAMLSTGECC